MQNEDAGPGAGFVYLQTNEPGRNRLLAFRRAGDGTLTPMRRAGPVTACPTT